MRKAAAPETGTSPRPNSDPGLTDAPPKSPAPRTAPPRRAPSSVTPGAGLLNAPLDAELTEVVCDLLKWRSRPGAEVIEKQVLLLPEEFDMSLKEPKRTYQVPLYISGKHPSDKASNVLTTRGDQIEGVRYYEDRVIERTADALGVKQEQLTRLGARLPRRDPRFLRNKARAVQFLQEAVREHDSAVDRRVRVVSTFCQSLKNPLVRALFNLRLTDVDEAVDGNLPNAIALCDGLARDFADQPVLPVLRSRFQQIFVAEAEKAVAEKRYSQARMSLRELEQRASGQLGPEATAIRDKLLSQSAGLLAEANRVQSADPARANKLLKEAALVWPDLAKLDAARRRLTNDYPILKCAYVNMGAEFKPLVGTSDAERHGTTLIFESLVHWTVDDKIGSHFEPGLAAGRPVSVERGRRFRLPPTSWSDSSLRRLTGEDVIWTMKVMEKLRAGSPQQSLLEKVSIANGDPYSADVRLKKDYWQPLALMQFKVLPKHHFEKLDLEKELPAFLANPVGTGPYVFGPKTEERDVRARFVANPRYRYPELPVIREIQFIDIPPEKNSRKL